MNDKPIFATVCTGYDEDLTPHWVVQFNNAAPAHSPSTHIWSEVIYDEEAAQRLADIFNMSGAMA